MMKNNIGICHLSIVPVRKEPYHYSEQVTQWLFGEFCRIIDHNKEWVYVEIESDHYKGWVHHKQMQVLQVSEQELQQIPKYYAKDNSGKIVWGEENQPVFAGSVVSRANLLNKNFIGEMQKTPLKLEEILPIYKNAPYQWGGKTAYGIDCSGLVQMVFRLMGEELPRDAYEQQQLGEEVSLQKAKPNDVAFFSNEQGRVTHTGIIGQNHQIIHAHAWVRTDLLLEEGIFDVKEKVITHKLHSIKRILSM